MDADSVFAKIKLVQLCVCTWRAASDWVHLHLLPIRLSSPCGCRNIWIHSVLGKSRQRMDICGRSIPLIVHERGPSTLEYGGIVSPVETHHGLSISWWYGMVVPPYHILLFCHCHFSADDSSFCVFFE